MAVRRRHRSTGAPGHRGTGQWRPTPTPPRPGHNTGPPALRDAQSRDHPPRNSLGVGDECLWRHGPSQPTPTPPLVTARSKAARTGHRRFRRTAAPTLAAQAWPPAAARQPWHQRPGGRGARRAPVTPPSRPNPLPHHRSSATRNTTSAPEHQPAPVTTARKCVSGKHPRGGPAARPNECDRWTAAQRPAAPAALRPPSSAAPAWAPPPQQQADGQAGERGAKRPLPPTPPTRAPPSAWCVPR